MAARSQRSPARNVVQLPSGKWNVRIRRKGLTDLSKTFTYQRKAEEWAELQRTRIINGEMESYIEDSAVDTLAEAFKAYLKDISPGKKGSRQEINRGNHMLDMALAKEMFDTRLHRLTGDQVSDYKNTRLKEVGNDTVRLELALISVIWNYYKKELRVKQLELLQNPVSTVAKPAPSKGRKRRLEPREEAYLMDALAQAKNPEAKAVVLLAVETAMRKGENMAIEWHRIDLQHGTINLFDTKNGEDRVIPLSGPAIGALKALPKTGKNVFHYTEYGIYKAWYNALKRARATYAKDCEKDGEDPDPGFLQNIRIHDLRHEATTRLFEDHDLSVMEASSVTGHKNPAMLQRYTHMKTAKNISQKMRAKSEPQEQPAPAVEDVISKLERLAALLEKGILTAEEFQAQKVKLLAGDAQ